MLLSFNPEPAFLYNCSCFHSIIFCEVNLLFYIYSTVFIFIYIFSYMYLNFYKLFLNMLYSFKHFHMQWYFFLSFYNLKKRNKYYKYHQNLLIHILNLLLILFYFVWINIKNILIFLATFWLMFTDHQLSPKGNQKF